MANILDMAQNRSRATFTVLVMIFAFGLFAYLTIPKESEPDIDIPFIYVSMSLEGVSPQDAERLLLRPMEEELTDIEGVKEMRSTAYEGGGNVVLEFDAGFDADQALTDVREKVDIAKVELPQDANEPRVQEVNFSLFPVITIGLSGNLPERTLVRMARDLQESIESIPDVLQATIRGDREEQVEIVIDPVTLEGYNLAADEATALVQRSNRLIAAGSLELESGRFTVKVPGLLESLEDIKNMPLKASGDATVTVGDVAKIHRTFKDAQSIARIDGQPAVTLEISKRSGRNIISTIEQVKAVTAEYQKIWPDAVSVSYIQDKSVQVRDMLRDLQNNVLSAIVLVMIVIVAILGLRGAGLVGISIPGSFLLGILMLYIMGLTVNIVVLFSLILAVGMLVDGAIVVCEYADRKMLQGVNRKQAYNIAARRMFLPILSSTATTLAAFMPLLFWPGIPGQFMRYMPLTLLGTLSASLLMALFFVPVLGSYFGKPGQAAQSLDDEDPNLDLSQYTGPTATYLHALRWSLRHPGKILLGAFAALIFIYWAYGTFGRGVEFFPKVEPDFAQLQVHARGNLSIGQKDALVRQVEQRIMDMPEFKTVYTTVIGNQGGQGFGQETAEDVIGIAQLEFVNWRQRRRASVILDEAVARTNDIPGIFVEPFEQQGGPQSGKPIQIEISSLDTDLLIPTAITVRNHLETVEGVTGVEDSRPVPGIEWQVTIDRAQALKFSTDLSRIGNLIRAITNGLIVDDYRPDDSDEEIDIVVRFPPQYRTLDQLDQLRIQTPQGLVPISNFVSRQAQPLVGRLDRVDGKRVLTVKADVKDGVLAADKVKEMEDWVRSANLDPRVDVVFKGENEEQQEAQAFLVKAFGVALFLMALILVLQFNNFYAVFLILSAVIMSTIGVFIGYLVCDYAFSTIMGGIGIIALAGIVVNNNIILLDTFNILKNQLPDEHEAILRTGVQRLRPVVMTAVTTILGLLPMTLGLNIDLFARDISLGAPSTQWWIQLATAIVFGLSFATILTLIVTPCALQARVNVRNWWAKARKWIVRKFQERRERKEKG